MIEYSSRIKEGIRLIDRHDMSHTVSSVWCAVWEDVQEPVLCHHTHCFGASKSSDYLGASYIVSRVQRNRAAEGLEFSKEIVHYFDWLFNDSPWNSIFVTKSGAQAWDERHLVVRTDVPSNLLIGGLMASRVVSESSNPMFVMYDMKDTNIPMNLAFLIGQCLLGGDMRRGTCKWGDTTAEHRAVGVGSMGQEAVLNFIDCYPSNCNSDHTVDTEYTSPYLVNEVWGLSDSNGSISGYIEREFDAEAILSEKEEIKLSLNPFKLVPEAPAGVVTYADAIKAMKIFWPQLAGAFGYELCDADQANLG